MFKEFVTGVISLAFLSVVSELLMPEGTMKKYLKLAFGFMMMCTLIMPVTKVIHTEPFEFSFDGSMSNEEITAKSDAYILKLHEDNIRSYLTKLFGNDTDIFIELYSDGKVKSIVVYTETADANLKEEAKRTLGCDSIKIIKRDENDV